MFPVLFSAGGFHFQTIWLFVIFGFLIFGYLVFLQSEDQLLPTTKIFDVVLISGFLGFIVSRTTEAFIEFGSISFFQFLKFWEINQTYFWGAVFTSFFTLLFFSKKFRLPQAKVIDIVSLSLPPTLALFYLGRIFELGITPVNIFAPVWFLVISAIFLKTSKRIQFPLFYFLITALAISASHLIFEIFEPQAGPKRIINFLVSALVLTTANVMFYKGMSRENFRENLKMFAGKTLEKIKRRLQKQSQTLETEIASLKKDDPFLAEGREVSREAGDDAAELEGHERITVVRENLKTGLVQVRKALAAIGLGKYGKCERCGRPIEARRLKVLPQATLCFSCEREVEKKSI